MKKRKGFSRSGSDSGVSCDGTKSPVNSEKNVELRAALEKKMKAFNNGGQNNTMEESRELEHGKLVSNDDYNNIQQKKICSTKTSINKVKPNTFDTLKLNSGLPITKKDYVKSSTRIRYANSTTVVTKCLVKNTDDWNKYLLGKSKNDPTSDESPDKSIKITSDNKEDTCTINKEKITPEKKYLRSGVEVKSAEKHTSILKMSSREKKPKIVQIKTGDSFQKESLDQTIKISDVHFTGPRNSNDRKISKVDNETLGSTILEVSQGTIEPCNKTSNIVLHSINETNSVEIRTSPRKKRSRNSLDCNNKSSVSNNTENQLSKRKRQISEPSKSETCCSNIEHDPEVVTENINSPFKTRTSTLKNRNNEPTIEEIKSPGREVQTEGNSIKTRAKQKLSFSEATSNDKINIFVPKSNLGTFVTSDVKEIINSPGIQSLQSNQTNSQTTENLELKSPKPKRFRKIKSPQKSPNKNENNSITYANIDYTNNTLQIPLNNNKSNSDTEDACITNLQKYAEFLQPSWNPTVRIERLRQFSGKHWVPRSIKNISSETVKSDPDVNSNTQCGAMNLTEIKTESTSPGINSESVILRDVRIVLEDIGLGKKHRKMIKLNRNWSLTRIGNRSKRFQYKYKTDLTAITSRNDLFQQAQLTKGFSLKSPLRSSIVLEEIPINESHITMLHSAEENVQIQDTASNVSEESTEINKEINNTSLATESIHKLDETDQVKHIPKMISVESVNVLKLSENSSSELITKCNKEFCRTETVKDRSSKTKKPKHIKSGSKNQIDMLKSKIRVKLPEKLFKKYNKGIEEKCANVLMDKKNDEIDIHDENKIHEPCSKNSNPEKCATTIIKKKNKETDVQNDKYKIHKLTSKYSVPVKIPIEIYNEYKKLKDIEKQKDLENSSENITAKNIPHDSCLKLNNNDKKTLSEKTDENIINAPTEKNNIPDTCTKSSVLETLETNVSSTDNQIKLNDKLLRKSIDTKVTRKYLQKNIQHKIMPDKHDNKEEKASLHADNMSKKIILRSKKEMSTESNANIFTKPKHVDENLDSSQTVETPNLTEIAKDITPKKDQPAIECTSDNASDKAISDSQLIQTKHNTLKEFEKVSEVPENIETSPIDQMSRESTIDSAVIITHSKPKKIFRSKEENSNIIILKTINENSNTSQEIKSVKPVPKNTGIVSPENRLSTETNTTSCSNISQRPKHIFKFSGTSTIKRPPTRQSGKIKLKRPILSPDVFKVPAVFSPISQSVKLNPQSPPKKKSPRKGNPNIIATVFPKKTEIEVDTISIYAETIGDSITDISVTNDSSDDSDSDENFDDRFHILPEPAKHTDVNEWVDNTVKICEIKKENPPLEKPVLPAEDIKLNNLGSEQETKETSLTNISNDSSLDRETDTYSVVAHYDKHRKTNFYNNSSQFSSSSNITRAIDIFKSVCSNFIKNGECTRKPCRYRHEYPANWNKEIDKLPTESLLALYDFAKENKAVHLYKHIFFTITEYIGNRRDFNTLIRMVRDVIEMDINSDRSPYITIIIDTLCKTGVTFNSIVEFVYKNANVGPDYINLLSDILINLIVDRADCDGNWITIRELLKNIDYALDNGIFRAIIVECLQKDSPKKELFLKVYHDLIKHIADDKLSHLNESILNNFYNRLLKFKLNIEADEYYERCQSLNITLGNKSDHSNSPASSITNSPAAKSITKVGPFLTIDNNHEIISPATPPKNNNFSPIKPLLPSVIHSNYSGTVAVPKKFTAPPPLIPFNPSPSSSSNVIPSYDLPGPSFVDDNFVAPNPPIYNRPVVLRQPSQERNRSLSDSGFRNNNLNSAHSRTSLSSTDSVSPVSSTFSSQIHYEVQTAIQREHIALFYSLVMKYKDNDLTDVFIKTAVEVLVQHNRNYPIFYTNLCETVILLNSIENPTLAYVLKTLGLNLLLFLTDQSDWEPAFMIYNTLKNHFKDLNDILNVKLYLKEKYSYFKRNLIIIELHIKKFKFQSAWNMLKEHIFQCNIWQGDNNELEILYRNKIVDELLSCIVQKKLWRLGLNIVQYVIKNNISDIEIKKHTNEIFLQAINSKCEISVFVEFEKCSPSWYNYISDIIYRSVLTHAVSKNEFALAKKFYEIGRHFDVYPDVCGNESFVQFKMSFVFEEILLIFEIFFEKMVRFYPIQHNITLRIVEGTQLHTNEHIPINLQQYKMTAQTMLTRLANILNNNMKPAITITNQNNSLIINADTINKHLDARMQRNTFDQLLRK